MSKICIFCSSPSKLRCRPCFEEIPKFGKCINNEYLPYYCSKECQSNDWGFHKLECLSSKIHNQGESFKEHTLKEMNLSIQKRMKARSINNIFSIGRRESEEAQNLNYFQLTSPELLREKQSNRIPSPEKKNLREATIGKETEVTEKIQGEIKKLQSHIQTETANLNEKLKYLQDFQKTSDEKIKQKINTGTLNRNIDHLPRYNHKLYTENLKKFQKQLEDATNFILKTIFASEEKDPLHFINNKGEIIDENKKNQFGDKIVDMYKSFEKSIKENHEILNLTHGDITKNYRLTQPMTEMNHKIKNDYNQVQDTIENEIWGDEPVPNWAKTQEYSELVVVYQHFFLTKFTSVKITTEQRKELLEHLDQFAPHPSSNDFNFDAGIGTNGGKDDKNQAERRAFAKKQYQNALKRASHVQQTENFNKRCVRVAHEAQDPQRSAIAEGMWRAWRCVKNKYQDTRNMMDEKFQKAGTFEMIIFTLFVYGSLFIFWKFLGRGGLDYVQGQQKKVIDELKKDELEKIKDMLRKEKTHVNEQLEETKRRLKKTTEKIRIESNHLELEKLLESKSIQEILQKSITAHTIKSSDEILPNHVKVLREFVESFNQLIEDKPRLFKKSYELNSSKNWVRVATEDTDKFLKNCDLTTGRCSNLNQTDLSNIRDLLKTLPRMVDRYTSAFKEEIIERGLPSETKAKQEENLAHQEEQLKKVRSQYSQKTSEIEEVDTEIITLSEKPGHLFHVIQEKIHTYITQTGSVMRSLETSPKNIFTHIITFIGDFFKAILKVLRFKTKLLFKKEMLSTYLNIIGSAFAIYYVNYYLAGRIEEFYLVHTLLVTNIVDWMNFSTGYEGEVGRFKFERDSRDFSIIAGEWFVSGINFFKPLNHLTYALSIGLVNIDYESIKSSTGLTTDVFLNLKSIFNLSPSYFSIPNTINHLNNTLIWLSTSEFKDPYELELVDINNTTSLYPNMDNATIYSDGVNMTVSGITQSGLMFNLIDNPGALLLLAILAESILPENISYKIKRKIYLVASLVAVFYYQTDMWWAFLLMLIYITSTYVKDISQNIWADLTLTKIFMTRTQEEGEREIMWEEKTSPPSPYEFFFGK
jgi:hypothetical protein